MGRKKGFKLSKEQKERMQAGRKKAKEKAMEGLIDNNDDYKPIKKKEERERIDATIIGFGIEKNYPNPYPLFKSDRKTYKGTIYKTIPEAKEGMKHHRY